jgi:hypothetical protein
MLKLDTSIAHIVRVRENDDESSNHVKVASEIADELQNGECAEVYPDGDPGVEFESDDSHGSFLFFGSRDLSLVTKLVSELIRRNINPEHIAVFHLGMMEVAP